MEKKRNLAQELYEEFNLRFDANSDIELIDDFNGQVGNGGSGTTKMSYLRALRAQLIKRNIDFSVVGDERSMSYAKK